MALETEVWEADIHENLYQDNPHMEAGIDHSQFVENRTVHMPVEGGDPNVVKDRTTYPAAISTLSETESTYQLGTYTTNPSWVEDVRKMEVSYQLRQSVLQRHERILNEEIGTETLYAWSFDQDGTKTVRTSGSSQSNVQAPGATGSRNAIHPDDLRRAAAVMDNDNVPMMGRIAMFPPDLYYQFLQYREVQDQNFMGSTGAVRNGALTTFAGFQIMLRPGVPVFDDSTTPQKKARGAATATGDNLAVLLWQEDQVAKAIGEISVYIEEGKADYHGDLMSALIRHGAAKVRANNVGLAAIVQQ